MKNLFLTTLLIAICGCAFGVGIDSKMLDTNSFFTIPNATKPTTISIRTNTINNLIDARAVNPTNGITAIQAAIISHNQTATNFPTDVTFPFGFGIGHWQFDGDPSSGGYSFYTIGDPNSTNTHLFLMRSDGHFITDYLEGDGSLITGISGATVTNIPAANITGAPTVPVDSPGLLAVGASGNSNLVVFAWSSGITAPFTNIPYAMIPHRTNNGIIFYHEEFTNAYQPAVP